jgi:hypothetical protein
MGPEIDWSMRASWWGCQIVTRVKEVSVVLLEGHPSLSCALADTTQMNAQTKMSVVKTEGPIVVIGSSIGWRTGVC